MRVFTLTKEQRIERPVNEVFAFFERPENLATITPPELGFRILTPTPIEMKPGTLIDYSVRILGVRTHWRTLICDYQPPHRFVDSQLKGPYTFWHHTHTFEEVDGGTIIRDEVRYVLPFGWLGRLMNRLVVRRQLRGIFEFRARVIGDHFAGAERAKPDRPVSA